MHFVRSSLSLWYHSLSASPGNTQNCAGRRRFYRMEILWRCDCCPSWIEKNGYILATIEQAESYRWHHQTFSRWEIHLCAGTYWTEEWAKKAPSAIWAIEIPQEGTKHSINVAVCTGIVVWDFVLKSYRWWLVVGCWLVVDGCWNVVLVDGLGTGY